MAKKAKTNNQGLTVLPGKEATGGAAKAEIQTMEAAFQRISQLEGQVQTLAAREEQAVKAAMANNQLMRQLFADQSNCIAMLAWKDDARTELLMQQGFGKQTRVSSVGVFVPPEPAEEAKPAKATKKAAKKRSKK